MNSKFLSPAVTAFLILLLVMLYPEKIMTQKKNPMSLAGLRRAAPSQVAMQGRFRVTLTGFTVNKATTESVLSTDGAGDEVYAMVNFAELWSSNNIFGALQRRQSLVYGDISGHRAQVAVTGIPLNHPAQPWVVRAGSASPSGGLVSGDSFPVPGEDATIRSEGQLPNANTNTRLIPMILWEGELRQGGPHPNSVVIIPTIWENDNVQDVLNVWSRQADAFLRRFAANSSRFIMGTARRPLVEQVDTVLSTVPQRNDFDRPIGMDGGAFNPLSATPDPATFIPAVMLLTFNSAQEAASSTSNSSMHGRGVVEIRYRDGQSYGPGDYTIFLLVEHLPDH